MVSQWCPGSRSGAKRRRISERCGRWRWTARCRLVRSRRRCYRRVLRRRWWENDKSGNYRLVKKDPSNNCGRDDVAAALVLLAGAMERRPKPRPSYLGMVA